MSSTLEATLATSREALDFKDTPPLDDQDGFIAVIFIGVCTLIFTNPVSVSSATILSESGGDSSTERRPPEDKFWRADKREERMFSFDSEESLNAIRVEFNKGMAAH